MRAKEVLAKEGTAQAGKNHAVTIACMTTSKVTRNKK